MKLAKITVLTAVLISGFVVGIWYGSRSQTDAATAAGVRKILHYTCPMHPQYTSDKPGDCPSCGMRLVPAYADGEESDPPAGEGGALTITGAIHISPEKQQIIGVQTGTVEKTSGTQTLRVLGRVTVDDTRVYRVNASIAGWIQEVYPNTVGSRVRKGQPLASFYSPEFINRLQAYLFTLGAIERYPASSSLNANQFDVTRTNLQLAEDNLRNLGMDDIQLEEMRKNRQMTQKIKIYSPTDGFVLMRNVSPGLRFEANMTLYQIADLSHVWIMADMFENEAYYFKPGEKATVSHPALKTEFTAQVSDVLPQFDATTRTLKVRLEADNPGFALRPDMFVDVEYPVSRPPALTVPSDAVLDSGLHKTVFVDLGKGYFEPRQVETGWRSEDRVEIRKGLMEGERIVISGNFLIDSESRLREAAMGAREVAVNDPVCGMRIDPATAGDRKSTYGGTTYYFCSGDCRQKFDRNPEKYSLKSSVK